MMVLELREIAERFAKETNNGCYCLLVYTNVSTTDNNIHCEYIKKYFPDKYVSIFSEDRIYFFFKDNESEAQNFYDLHYPFFRKHLDYFYFELNINNKFQDSNT